MQLLKAFHKAKNSIPLLYKLYIGFGAILLVFSFVTFTYVRQSGNIKEAIGSLIASTEVQRLAEGLEIAAINSETGVRGFQVTEDTSFLEPYYKGQLEFDSKLNWPTTCFYSCRHV